MGIDQVNPSTKWDVDQVNHRSSGIDQVNPSIKWDVDQVGRRTQSIKWVVDQVSKRPPRPCVPQQFYSPNVVLPTSKENERKAERKTFNLGYQCCKYYFSIIQLLRTTLKPSSFSQHAGLPVFCCLFDMCCLWSVQ